MQKRLELLTHAFDRIKQGDEQGRRTQLKTTQVRDMINDPCIYVPFRGKVSDGRVFFSSVDQKCLVAWLEECKTHIKVHTIENHHHRIPLPVLLQAEQNVLGPLGFLRRSLKPPANPVYDVECRIGSGSVSTTLSGYLHPGISWWRSVVNVRRLLDFIQKHDVVGDEWLNLKGQIWHGRERRLVHWDQSLPLALPRALYQAGNQSGVMADFSAIAAEVLEQNIERRKVWQASDSYVGARAKRK